MAGQPRLRKSRVVTKTYSTANGVATPLVDKPMYPNPLQRKRCAFDGSRSSRGWRRSWWAWTAPIRCNVASAPRARRFSVGVAEGCCDIDETVHCLPAVTGVRGRRRWPVRDVRTVRVIEVTAPGGIGPSRPPARHGPLHEGGDDLAVAGGPSRRLRCAPRIGSMCHAQPRPASSEALPLVSGSTSATEFSGNSSRRRVIYASA